MNKQKTLVTALQPFAHGNVSAQAGKVYAMNPGDAEDLRKAGFVSLDAAGDAEQTQNDVIPQKKQPGDVVVDDADDLLGEGKAAAELENKMERPVGNKTTAKSKA